MAKPVRFVISNAGNLGSDAPAVKDLCKQILNFVVFAEGVEECNKGKKMISWHVTSVSMQSPITMEFTPVCADEADPSLHTQQVVESIVSFAHEVYRSPHVTNGLANDAVSAFDNMHDIVVQHSNRIEIDFSEYVTGGKFFISRESAANYLFKKDMASVPRDLPESESGSLEGYVLRVDRNQQQRPTVLLRARIDGQIVKCVATGSDLDDLGKRMIKEIFESLRIRVDGTIHYKSVNVIDYIDADSFYVYPPNDSLPSAEEFFDPNFTGGLESCEYLKIIREKRNE